MKLEQEHPGWRTYLLPTQQGSNLWCDGYSKHQMVIIDELRKGSISYVNLLIMFDPYQATLPKKGGFIKWNPKV
jgi:hypothetical protein